MKNDRAFYYETQLFDIVNELTSTLQYIRCEKWDKEELISLAKKWRELFSEQNKQYFKPRKV